MRISPLYEGVVELAYFTHGLKIWPEYFKEVIAGNKTFEIRQNDRSFHVGDRLLLNEWDPKTQNYTGRRTSVRVTYITNFAQVDNNIVMGIKLEA